MMRPIMNAGGLEADEACEAGMCDAVEAEMVIAAKDLGGERARCGSTVELIL